jgi:hypothetical protein
MALTHFRMCFGTRGGFKAVFTGNELNAVMAGLVPAIHALLAIQRKRKTWMPGTRPGMTRRG